MRLEELIDRMIPFDSEKRMPCFSDILTLNDILISKSQIKELQALLEHEDLPIKGSNIEGILKWLRKKNYSLVKDFEIKLLETYFSNPIIIEKLTGGSSTLFPHQKSLPEIDFELLEPVLNLDKRISSNGE